mmetsp:Transcript_65084/g.136343  ORF Transcript_65084/g.136343 Transcript_65084/m.136343 type:complete len:167 (+) Transcript_65084:124-624(+)
MFSCCCQSSSDRKKDVDRVGTVSALKDDQVEEVVQDSPKTIKEEPRALPESPKTLEPEPTPPTTQAPQPQAPPAPTKAPAHGLFEVTIERTPVTGKLGIDVARSELGLRITAINAGDIHEFNVKNPNFALQAADMIVGINGVRGTGNDLLAAIRDTNPLLFVIERP